MKGALTLRVIAANLIILAVQFTHFAIQVEQSLHLMTVFRQMHNPDRIEGAAAHIGKDAVIILMPEGVAHPGKPDNRVGAVRNLNLRQGGSRSEQTGCQQAGRQHQAHCEAGLNRRQGHVGMVTDWGLPDSLPTACRDSFGPCGHVDSNRRVNAFASLHPAQPVPGQFP